ncbi:MAG: hypothetical protein KAG64_05705 [Bacteroidales bacterium]|nr:hypothetical protein [Bacteroidales bacterium]
MATIKHFFFEEQKQVGAPVWIILASIAAVSFSLMYINYDAWNIHEKFSQKELLLLASIVVSMFVGLFFLFLNIKMQTKIDKHGISFRYPPFISKFKKIAFSEMRSFEVIEYQPLKEYGGWGYKKPGKPHNKNTAYSIKGKTGLKMKLISGKTILLGTQRKDALNYALQKLKGEA